MEKQQLSWIYLCGSHGQGLCGNWSIREHVCKEHPSVRKIVEGHYDKNWEGKTKIYYK
jgi:hypothetical protein